jgi:predicted RNA methylase
VRLERIEERTVEGVRVFSLRRAVDWAAGTTTFSVDALLTGPTTSYTVISDSPRMEWTVNNFEGFLPRLVDIALLQRP